MSSTTIEQTSAVSTPKGGIGLRRFGWAIAYAVYAALLNYLYVNFIQPQFYYMGMKIDPTVGMVPMSCLYVAIAGFICPNKFQRPSDLYLVFSFITNLAPVLVLLQHFQIPASFSITVVAAFAILVAISSATPAKIGLVGGGYQAVIAGAILLVSIVLISSLSQARGLWDVSLLNDLYKYRDGAGDSAGLFGYVLAWGQKVFIMLLLSIVLWRRRWGLVVFLLGLQFLTFMATKEKVNLFMPVFVMLAFAAFEWRMTPLRLFSGLVALVVAGITLQAAFNNVLLNVIVIRRVFFVPATLVTYYYKAFDVYGYLYWSHVGGNLFGARDDGPAGAMIVGALVSNSSGAEQNADTGFLGSGYMQAGYVGVLLYAVLIGISLFLINSLTHKRMPKVVGAAIGFWPMYAVLEEADLPATLLTHGLFVTLLSLYFLGSKHWCDDPASDRDAPAKSALLTAPNTSEQPS